MHISSRMQDLSKTVLSTLICCLLAGCGSRPTTTSVAPDPTADASARVNNPEPPTAAQTEPGPAPVSVPAPGFPECQTNAACPPDQLCLFPAGSCGQANGLGHCEPRGRLALCPDWDHCPEVCGCDNQTYCDECQAHTAGVNVAHQGSCCDDVAADYVAAVDGAKQCCAASDEETCTVVVPSSLPCGGCETTISAAPDWRLRQVMRLARQWTDQQCDLRVDRDCPDKACPVLQGGSCQPVPGGGSTGRCADLFAD